MFWILTHLITNYCRYINLVENVIICNSKFGHWKYIQYLNDSIWVCAKIIEGYLEQSFNIRGEQVRCKMLRCDCRSHWILAPTTRFLKKPRRKNYVLLEEDLRNYRDRLIIKNDITKIRNVLSIYAIRQTDHLSYIDVLIYICYIYSMILLSHFKCTSGQRFMTIVLIFRKNILPKEVEPLNLGTCASASEIGANL